MTVGMDRRTLLCATAASFGLLVVPATAWTAAPAEFVMWHSAGCGCCLEWARRIERQFGRSLPIVEVADIAAVKRAQGVPDDLWSCHTARVGGFVVEGHVPPADIQRLVERGAKAIRGLAVPGMPLGSPGMEAGHGRTEPFNVYAFGADGRRVTVSSYG